ncbi:GNAT family protein [uncultured Brevundimonas sp.]|uniref:GNAT family N-acetyltransferase n=1 Tax=uncultured Brevundimonas sp. TaxID=213418 RepID=UPI0026250327|nr:GNAT family protein [uncultured Brevundimonas sp.]
MSPVSVRDPIIETERLILRPFEPEDFAAYCAYHVRGDVYRYLYAAPPDRETLQRQYTSVIRPVFVQQGDVFKLAVIAKDGDYLVGEVLLKFANEQALQGEVGYIFDPTYAGHGFATEATRAIITYGFQQFGLHRIFARLDTGNTGSIGVVERLKLRREAHFVQNERFSGIWGSEYVYAILEHEWASMK